MKAAQTVWKTVEKRVGSVIVGKREVTWRAVVALLCGGHMLIDDVPGTGKTVFSRTFAGALSLRFGRLQCTPDQLPGDITGVSYFDMKTSEFRFLPGPVFTDILLADEINRAMPKTQAGLLECMAERQVTVEGKTYPLDVPFMVIATQNPVETKGTFDLPEAELDRFLIRTDMGYPSPEESLEMARRKFGTPAGGTPVENPLPAPVERQMVLDAMEEVRQVYVHEDIMRYAVELAEATRQDSEVELGVSPRGVVHLLEAARASAAMEGRDYVLPDDVKGLAVSVMAHRLIVKNDFFLRRGAREQIIERILDRVPVPTEEIDFFRAGR